MQFKLFVKLSLIFLMFSGINILGQQRTDSTNSFIGMIEYGNYCFLVSQHGIKLIGKAKSINQKYSEYYKRIYGKDAENPNFVFEGNDELKFVPLVPLNQLPHNGNFLVDGFSASKLYNLSDVRKVNVYNELINKLQNQIMRTLENNKD